MIDFLSFHLADMVFFETSSQAIYSSKKFLLREEKCNSLPTGFNEIEFEEALIKPIKPLELSETDTTNRQLILFRGKDNKEAGIEKILDAARELGNNCEFLIVTNEKILNLPRNATLINRFISKNELVWLYQNSRVILGQFGNSSRLDRTVPHKFF
jgi:hypothetical protein